MNKNPLKIEVLEKNEVLCDFCNGVIAGVGIGLAVVALT